VIEYEYLVYDEYGYVLFSYDNEEDALTRAYSRDGWSVSRISLEEKERDEQNT